MTQCESCEESLPDVRYYDDKGQWFCESCAELFGCDPDARWDVLEEDDAYNYKDEDEDE